MAVTPQELTESKLGETHRRDAWRREPLVIAVGLGLFVAYAAFRAFYNGHYQYEHVLSPFYSPLIIWKGMPPWLSPALFILWIPAGFRLTCYYFRKAYYRAYLNDPPACAVGEDRGHEYKGETGGLIFQNIHRFFLYFAILLIVFLVIDAAHAFRWDGGFGISVGTLVLTADVILVALYTFSCHSFRHLVGGNVNCFSCAKRGEMRFKMWRTVTVLNERHRLWAWASLFTVAFADFYVWMVSAGVIRDIRIL
jgi:hypothetical protein